MSAAKAPSLTKTHAAPGEPLVWLTAMGLALGLLMVAGLLGVIVANGVPVFWPAPLVEVTLKPGVQNPVPGGGETFVGRLVQQRVKRTPVLDAAGRPQADQSELQYFIGNKDGYGSNFVFINRADIAKTRTPKDILVIERMEYGPAFGFPQRLATSDGKTLPASDPAFPGALRALVAEGNARRRALETIEKRDIGRINAEMNELKIRGRDSSAPTKAMTALEARYETLASEARALRLLQTAATLTYQLPNGAVKELPIGNILGYYQPNQIGIFRKLGLFLHNIWNFLSQDPREANTEGGVFPAIFGTFVMTMLMSLAVVPFGVIAAIYLREYARQGFFVRAVRIAINNLAGVPSIVFGVFGLGFFVYFLGGSIDKTFFGDYLPTPTFGTGGILWAALTLALMTVPVVIVATEEAIAAVPRGMKEGSLACGASKWQTIQRIILPASLPGILTGLVLAMARGAGEVAPLMLVGVVKLAPSLPIDGEFPFLHPERKFMHLGFHIYDLGFQSPDSEAAKPMVFATTLLLILLVVALNLFAIVIRERLRKKYATGAF